MPELSLAQYAEGGLPLTTSGDIYSSFAVEFPNQPKQGSLLVAFINNNAEEGTPTVSSIKSSGATWTKIGGGQPAYASNAYSELWYAPYISQNPSPVVLITLSADTAYVSAVIAEFTGLAYSSPLDKTASSITPNFYDNTTDVESIGPVTTGTTSQALELWVAAVVAFDGSTTAVTGSGGFGPIGPLDPVCQAQLFYRMVNSKAAASITATFTPMGDTNYGPPCPAAFVATFKAALAPLPSAETHLTLAVDNFIIYAT